MPAVAIIVNGISRKKKKFYDSILPSLSRFHPEVFETQFAGHALELAARAAQTFDILIAAGGDGTLNQVLNGAMQNSLNAPTIGLIPMGTGNDFARTCLIKLDSIGKLLEVNRPVRMDIGKITSRQPSGENATRFFLNECSVGMGPAVVQKLEQSSRALGPTLTYWKTIITTFFTHRPQYVECKTAGWEWRGKIRVCAIANGRTFGHGLHIAPDAQPDDGKFNTFIAGDLPLLKFLIYQQQLKGTRKVSDDLIRYNTTLSAELNSPEVCYLEAEGEIVGSLPAIVEIMPQRISFLK